MRPDRIIVGECRGGEALDMLQAMNTGHDGSMTTIHANTSEDVILRLEVLVQMAADLPIDSIHRQIASAIDLIVQLSRLRDGSRRVTQVTEVIDYDEREHTIRTKDIFRMEDADGEAQLDPDRLAAHVSGRIDRTGVDRHGVVLPVGKPLQSLMILTSTLAAFSAAFLAALWIGPAWDRVSRSYVGDMVAHLQALGASSKQVAFYMRWWGIAMVAVPLVAGFVLRMVPVALGLTYLLFVGPRDLLGWRIAQRRILLRDQMVKAAVALANSARAGLSQAQGLELIARETPDPLASEFRRIVGDYQAGRPLARALEETQKRLGLDSFTIFSTVLMVCMERGGNVAFALDRISTNLQELQRLERKLETSTASGRRMALILGAFPFVFLGGFTLLDPDMMNTMYTSLIGQLVLLGVGVLVYVSFLWCEKIMKVEF